MSATEQIQEVGKAVDDSFESITTGVKEATRAGEENIEKTSKSAEQVINEIKEEGLAKYKVLQEEADAAADKLKSDYETAKEKTAQRLAAIERGINAAIGKKPAAEAPKGPTEPSS